MSLFQKNTTKKTENKIRRKKSPANDDIYPKNLSKGE
jgi:hypothetical protein